MTTDAVRTTSIRVALADLRDEIRTSEHPARDVGHHSRAILLDDGSWLCVELAPAFGGGLLMGVYQATRRGTGGHVSAVYPLGKAGVGAA